MLGVVRGSVGSGWECSVCWECWECGCVGSVDRWEWLEGVLGVAGGSVRSVQSVPDLRGGRTPGPGEKIFNAKNWFRDLKSNIFQKRKQFIL